MLTWWVLVSVCISVIEPSNKIGAGLILGILVANLMSDLSNALACRLIRRRLRSSRQKLNTLDIQSFVVT